MAAAYAAVISLKHTINGLLNSCRISPVSSTRELIEPAYNQTTSLQQILGRLNDRSRSSSRSSREKVEDLEGKIRDFAHKLEEVMELHELNPHEDDELVRTLMTMMMMCIEKLIKDYDDDDGGDDDDDDDDDDDGDDEIGNRNVQPSPSSNIDFGVEMVGRSREFKTIIQKYLTNRMRPDDLWFYGFLGERGTGRTLSAKNTFEDLRKGRSTQIFECWAWVTIDPQHKLKEILIRIIAQVDNLVAEVDFELLISQEDEKLSKYLYKLLKHRRYMIVLDDVDDLELVNYLRRTSFPDQSNGSVVFLTTSLKEIDQLADAVQSYALPTTFFVEMTMPILRDNWANTNESIAEELEIAGKKILENCRGRMISFAKTLMFLFKSETTVEQWSKIAADEQNPIFMVANELSELRQIKTELQYHNRAMTETISKLLRFSDENVRFAIHPERLFSRMQILSIFGMAGLGKTTFATKVFKDESILSHFDHQVWINLGPKYQTEEILIDILAQIYPNIHKLHMKGDEKLVGDLCVQLSCKRCLIVLDDLCSKAPLLYLKNLFPDIKGITLVTTRLAKVAKFRRGDSYLEMQLLDNEESWCLLHQKVFATGSCPRELEKAGRKIAEKCDGLPLLILTVAQELLKVDITQEYWNNVASGKEKSVFKNAHHQISEALLPSYHSLPQHLKPCFLYIGIFLEKYEIPVSNLTNLWISEGFLEPNLYQLEEDFVAECLVDLVDKSVVMFQRNVSGYEMKTCRLHSVFWHLANSEAVKNKFFHAMNSYDDCSTESIKSQHRLCIRNSVLLGMKYVQNSMASNTCAHSLLCVSALQQYPVPLNFDFGLLRVMNAITIRLYQFPVEVVSLFNLRYLGLTCDGNLPTSISYLWRLQYLIVKRSMNIKSTRNSSHLPVEIWDMKELKHLQIMGGCLPDNKCGTGLLKLSTLLDVSAQSCREEVLKWIPNLKRLGILIELAPDDYEDNSNSFRCLNNISLLDVLQELKCVVVNPHIGSDVVAPPAPLSMFPPSLKKLSLSGLGYPWEHMSIIGKLKNLQVLKLKNYAFQGPTWVVYGPFEKLQFLLIEDSNLVQLKLEWRINPNLDCLCLKHCYKLKELPASLVNNSVRKIKIVDCSPFTMSWAEQMGKLANRCEVNVHASWFAKTHQQ